VKSSFVQHWPPNVHGGPSGSTHLACAGERATGAAVTMGAPHRRLLRRCGPGPTASSIRHRSPDAAVGVPPARPLQPRHARVLTLAITEFAPYVCTRTPAGHVGRAQTRPSEMGVAHVHTIHDYWLLCQRASMVSSDGVPCDDLCGACAAVSRIRARLMRRHGPDVYVAVSAAVAHEHERLSAPRGRMRVILNPFTTGSSRSGRRMGDRPSSASSVSSWRARASSRCSAPSITPISPGPASGSRATAPCARRWRRASLRGSSTWDGSTTPSATSSSPRSTAWSYPPSGRNRGAS